MGLKKRDNRWILLNQFVADAQRHGESRCAIEGTHKDNASHGTVDLGLLVNEAKINSLPPKQSL